MLSTCGVNCLLSLIRSFMEYSATVWDLYQKYHIDNVAMVQHRAANFIKSKYSRYSCVLFICLMSWGGRLFLKGDRRLD